MAIPVERLRLCTAFFLIYFIWGSTYLAIRYAIETIPPFLMAGARFTAAGLLMFAVLRLRGVPAPSRLQWVQLGVVGTFLFLGGNGFVVWAEQFIASGLAALLVSTLPVWLILLDWLWAGGPRPSGMAVTGIGLGILGTLILVDPVQLAGSSNGSLYLNNLQLLQNMISYALADSELAAIRSRAQFNRTLPTLSIEARTFWEYANYATALLLLLLLFAVERALHARKKARYQQFIPA